jgi:Cu/Ag efflux protein CusF
MKTLIVTLFSLALVMGLVITAGQAASPDQAQPGLAKFVGGTIEEIDHAALRVTIQTEMGQKESLPVTDAKVITGLSKGDRVSVEMDEQGKVMKIVKLAPDRKGAPEPGS